MKTYIIDFGDHTLDQFNSIVEPSRRLKDENTGWVRRWRAVKLTDEEATVVCLIFKHIRVNEGEGVQLLTKHFSDPK